MQLPAELKKWKTIKEYLSTPEFGFDLSVIKVRSKENPKIWCSFMKTCPNSLSWVIIAIYDECTSKSKHKVVQQLPDGYLIYDHEKCEEFHSHKQMEDKYGEYGIVLGRLFDSSPFHEPLYQDNYSQMEIKKARQALLSIRTIITGSNHLLNETTKPFLSKWFKYDENAKELDALFVDKCCLGCGFATVEGNPCEGRLCRNSREECRRPYYLCSECEKDQTVFLPFKRRCCKSCRFFNPISPPPKGEIIKGGAVRIPKEELIPHDVCVFCRKKDAPEFAFQGNMECLVCRRSMHEYCILPRYREDLRGFCSEDCYLYTKTWWSESKAPTPEIGFPEHLDLSSDSSRAVEGLKKDMASQREEYLKNLRSLELFSSGFLKKDLETEIKNGACVHCLSPVYEKNCFKVHPEESLTKSLLFHSKKDCIKGFVKRFDVKVISIAYFHENESKARITFFSKPFYSYSPESKNMIMEVVMPSIPKDN
jgi:hypothetical protein